MGSHYLGFFPKHCMTIGNTGSGGSNGEGGSGSGSGTANSGQISPECLRQAKAILSDAAWKKTEELLKNPPLFDIDATPSLFDVQLASMAVDRGTNYFGNYARPGENLSTTVERYTESGGAVSVRNKGVDGIYFRGPLEVSGNFLLHEVLHLVYPESLLNDKVDLDTALIEALNIEKDPGMTDSEAVSRYFNSGCDSKYGGLL